GCWREAEGTQSGGGGGGGSQRGEERGREGGGVGGEAGRGKAGGGRGRGAEGGGGAGGGRRGEGRSQGGEHGESREGGDGGARVTDENARDDDRRGAAVEQGDWGWGRGAAARVVNTFAGAVDGCSRADLGVGKGTLGAVGRVGVKVAVQVRPPSLLLTAL
ncbi:hypothetical protein B1218_34770, partial [Pseudomonas ogarae]